MQSLDRLDRLVFWEPVVSPHKADLFEAVAALAPHIEVVCCADAALPAERADMGWSVAPGAAVTTVVAPSAADIAALLDRRPESSFHVFAGIRWVPTLVAALRQVRRDPRIAFGIMSEPRADEGLAGLLRRLQSWAGEGWLRRRARCVLAQGRNGPPWFIGVGYPPAIVFPFAYFVDPPPLPGQEPRGEALRIGYVGRLEADKGVADALEAVAALGPGAEFVVVGDGAQAAALRSRAQALGVRVDWRGIVPIAQIPAVMRSLDVLVLASRTKDDGWGVVVSEALMSGTAAVATDRAGASIVLDDPLLGRVCRARDPRSISAAIRELQAGGGFDPATREQRALAARDMLGAASGAAQLLAIVRHCTAGGPRPAPFYQRGTAT